MKSIVALAAALFLAATPGHAAEVKKAAAGKPEWHMNATIIEACSCPMFCQCYFNSQPAAHGGHGEGSHFCKFNNAFKINKGHKGDVKLDGAKFWVSGDLGGDFSTGKMDWAVVTFDKATTPAQREAIQAVVAHLYPVEWNSVTSGEGEMSWTFDKAKGEAHALMDGGKTAEVKLHSQVNATTPGEPIVIKNLKYWGAPRNDGFVLMPNIVQAYRAGEKAFEYKGTNGFMITLDIDSTTAPPAAGASGQ